MRSIPTADHIAELLKEVEKLEEDERKAAFAELQDCYQRSVNQIEDPPKLPSHGQQGTVDSLPSAGPPPPAVASLEQQLQVLTARLRHGPRD